MMASGRSKILVRVDGSAKLGMGHVMRCIRLSRHLTGKLSSKPQIEFAVADGEGAKQVIRSAGYSIHDPPKPFGPDAYDTEGLPEIIRAFAPDVIIVDCNWSEHPELVSGFPGGIPVISLHEHNFPVLEGVATAFNPSLVGQVPAPGGRIGQTHFQGADYLLLDEEIHNLPVRGGNDFRSPAKAVICMGGADPERLTVLSAIALSEMKDLKIAAIVGPAFHEDVQKQLEGIYGLKIHLRPSKVIGLLADADLAVVNAATAMLESMALAVPTIAIPRNPYESEQADACVSAGAIVAVEGKPREEDIRSLALRIITEPRLRERLSTRGRKMIDGKGIIRAGEIIASHLS
jgi:spore coat polysaccharide biosynthesis predicted glycosyltransferase SpsG